MPRYVCIHGHFYQPPRENPWLESVELQESAAPWHDWNERITAECYRRNAASRILDDEGNIRKICNNYSRMSFNMGPTLLSWMKEKAPRCYQGILNADMRGIQRFSGHGPAIAQVYNHIIMPLANRRDKVTQVKWGIRDFKRRFGRDPEGMWLAETAVDTETLEVLAENGIRFTILAPKQAEAVRALKDAPDAWHDVRWEKIETSIPYTCHLPSGRSIALFFYDGSLSQGIAFGGLLNDGGYYAKRLIDATPDSPHLTLSHVATDGESYGHHHDHGDMALAYCLEAIDRGHEATLTIYGEFLEKCPPRHEVRIVENSSWSCAHGVERWRSDCGCSSGTPGYRQEWRAPLREALDWLRDELAGLFEREAAPYLKDPWGARDMYIDLILDRSRENVERWFDVHTTRPLTPEEKVSVLKLLEIQRSSLLMYTSCGWFFDEISGLETVQILRYASRAIHLAHELTGIDLEREFVKRLEKAPSNVPELSNGGRIYELLVTSSQISFERLAANYGMLALFPRQKALADGCWDVTCRMANDSADVGTLDVRGFIAGEVDIVSRITWEEKSFIFATNYREDLSIVCGVLNASEENREELAAHPGALRELFAGDSDEKMVARFKHNLFSLRHILRDAQRDLLNKLLVHDTARIEVSLRDIVHDYDKLMAYLATVDIKAPSVIASAASMVLTADVVRCLEEEKPNIESLRHFMTRAKTWGLTLDDERVGFALSHWMMHRMAEIQRSPTDLAQMDRFLDVLFLFTNELKRHVSLYETQNLYFATWEEFARRNDTSSELRTSLLYLGKALRFSEEALA